MRQRWDLVGRLYGYELGHPMAELLPSLAVSSAPFVVFVDSVATFDHLSLAWLRTACARSSGLHALTLATKCRTTILPATGAGASGAQVAQRQHHSPFIPSWFAVVTREVLNASGFFDYEYKTLEYCLLELSNWLAQHDYGVFRNSAHTAGFDFSAWARDLLVQSGPQLADDLTLYTQAIRPGAPRLPPPAQLQVESASTLVAGHLPRLRPLDDGGGPRFSILCPVFRSQYFKDMLASVRGQTWEDWELVLVVDGPAEHEQRVIEDELSRSETDHRIKRVFQSNQGTGPSRRRALSLATGDFVMFLDDDDLLPAHALETFAASIRQLGDVAVLRGGMYLFGLTERYLNPRPRLLVSGISNDIFEVGQPFVVKRSLCDGIAAFEGDPALRGAGEDTDLFLRLDRIRARTCVIDQPLYMRRIASTNQSLRFGGRDFMNHLENMYRRHHGETWCLKDIHFEKDGEFILQSSLFSHATSEQTVLCGTRYYNYHTLGEAARVNIDLEVSSQCNACCATCPRPSLRRRGAFLSMGIVSRLAQELRCDQIRRKVILSGIGEPFLHPELDRIVETLFRAGAQVCITTNGTLLNPGRFGAICHAGLSELNVSVNAITRRTHQKMTGLDCFDAIVANLRAVLLLRDSDFPDVRVNVSFLLCDATGDEMMPFIREWQGTGISEVWIHPVNNRAGLLSGARTSALWGSQCAAAALEDKVIVDVFGAQPESPSLCPVLASMLFISVDGDVLLCAMDYSCKALVGSIRTSSAKDLHVEKISRCLRGEFRDLCGRCSFGNHAGKDTPQCIEITSHGRTDMDTRAASAVDRARGT